MAIHGLVFATNGFFLSLPLELWVVPCPGWGAKNRSFYFLFILTTTLNQILIMVTDRIGWLCTHLEASGGTHRAQGMQTCVCICICVRMCAGTAVYAPVRVRMHMGVLCICICLHESVHTCAVMRVCIHKHVYMSTCVHLTRVPCVFTGLLKASGQGGLVLIMEMGLLCCLRN